jgi:hypothetical protein
MLLRTALPTAGRWVRFNAVAWILGLSWTFAPPALVTPNTPVVSEIGVYAIAGILMATTVAIVTGLCWLSWLKRGNVRTDRTLGIVLFRALACVFDYAG